MFSYLWQYISTDKNIKNPEFHSTHSYEMAVELHTPAEIEDHLETLKILLLDLPDSVPDGSQFYNFAHFVPNPEKVEDFGGEDCAVNHALEITFCPLGRRDGPIISKEKGPGLVSVVDVLDHWTQAYPTSTVLQKWVFDLIEAANHLGAVSYQLRHTCLFD